MIGKALAGIACCIALNGTAFADAARSERTDGTIVQRRISGAQLPMPYGGSAIDPFLKYAPASLPAGATSYHGGPAISVLVLALDRAQSGLQIFLGSMESNAGLFGFDGRTGDPLPGFSPAPRSSGTPYSVGVATAHRVPSANTSDAARPHYEIVSGHFSGGMRRLDAAGAVVWSRNASNFISTPGTSFGAFDRAGLGDPRFVIDEESFDVFGRSARTGDVVWTASNGVSQEIHTAAVTGSGNDASFVVGTGTGNNQCELQRYRISDGARLWRQRFYCDVDTFVAAGDVDGIPGDEIVSVVTQDSYPFAPVAVVLDAADGHLLWSFPLGDSSSYGTAPALADLDGEPGAEIVVQTETMLHVVKYGQGEMDGWPAQLCAQSQCWMGSSAPVIGDLDGDSAMEIAVTTQVAGSSERGHLHVFDQSGRRDLLLAPAPMPIGSGRVPAIADVDGDGHNELVVGGNAWSGATGSYTSLWVLDFSRGNPKIRHGAVPWGQLGADPSHSNRAMSPPL